MKKLTCDICQFRTQGETFEEWMEALKPHYAEAHSDFMQQQEARTPDEQKAEMQKWASANKSRFDAA